MLFKSTLDKNILLLCHWILFQLNKKDSKHFYYTHNAKVNSQIREVTMCVKDCGLHNQNINMVIIIAFLVGWLNSIRVEIQKKNKARSYNVLELKYDLLVLYKS